MTYTVAWLLWILAFAGIEGTALLSKDPAGTLSDHVWSWFSIRSKGTAWRLRRFALLAGLAWLVAHFLTGGRF